jgi:hypothetical protein
MSTEEEGSKTVMHKQLEQSEVKQPDVKGLPDSEDFKKLFKDSSVYKKILEAIKDNPCGKVWEARVFYSHNLSNEFKKFLLDNDGYIVYPSPGDDKHELSIERLSLNTAEVYLIDQMCKAKSKDGDLLNVVVDQRVYDRCRQNIMNILFDVNEITDVTTIPIPNSRVQITYNKLTPIKCLMEELEDN